MQKKEKKIAAILLLYYEESVCPLLLKYNKVYFVSPLIAKPTAMDLQCRVSRSFGSGKTLDTLNYIPVSRVYFDRS